MAVAGADVKQLLLQVDASVELAKRNLNSLAGAVARDAAKMDGSLAKVDSAFDRGAAAAGRFGVSIGGLIAGVGIGTFVTLGREVLEFADDLATAADQAGLSVERYQTLKEALRTLEIDGTKADKIFKVLQSTLGDVQSGADNSATKALERLGITADIMSGQITTSDQLLDALAEASRNAGSEAQFASDLVDIFGKKIGVDLAAAIGDGGAALHQLEADFAATGAVIDAAMIQKLADANEAIDRFAANAKQQLVIFAGSAIDSFESVIVSATRLQQKLYALVGLSGIADSIGRDIAAYEARATTASTIQEQKWKVAVAKAELSKATAGGASIPAQGQRIADLRRETAELDRLNSIYRDNASRAMPRVNERDLRPPEPAGGGGGRGRRGGGGGGRRGGGRTARAEPTAAELRDRAMLDDDGIFGAGPALDFFEQPLADINAIKVNYAELQTMLDSTRIPDLGSMLSLEDQDRLEGFTRDIADGLAGAIVFGEDLGDTLVNAFKRAAAEMISSGILNFLTGGKQGTSFGTMLTSVLGAFGGGRASGVPNGALRGQGGGGLSVTINAPGATAETVSMIRREIAAAAPLIISASSRTAQRDLSRPRLG
jgi:hypothetical protein